MIILLGLLSSCNNHEPDDKAHSIEAALKNCKEALLSKYASDIEYIPLKKHSVSSCAYCGDTQIVSDIKKYPASQHLIWQGFYLFTIVQSLTGEDPYTSQ